jgi:serine/threonine protein kinase
MVHGGLLPENILVKLSEGEVKLTDFGLSSLNKDIATESPYISPEL